MILYFYIIQLKCLTQLNRRQIIYILRLFDEAYELAIKGRWFTDPMYLLFLLLIRELNLFDQSLQKHL